MISGVSKTGTDGQESTDSVGISTDDHNEGNDPTLALTNGKNRPKPVKGRHTKGKQPRIPSYSRLQSPPTLRSPSDDSAESQSISEAMDSAEAEAEGNQDFSVFVALEEAEKSALDKEEFATYVAMESAENDATSRGDAPILDDPETEERAAKEAMTDAADATAEEIAHDEALNEVLGLLVNGAKGGGTPRANPEPALIGSSEVTSIKSASQAATPPALAFKPNKALPPLKHLASEVSSSTVQIFQSVQDQSAAAASVPSLKIRPNRPVFFMHLHKAAGTTLCELAVQNKQRAAGMKSIGTKEVK